MAAATDPRVGELCEEIQKLAETLGVPAPAAGDLTSMTRALADLRRRAEDVRRSEARFRLLLGEAPIILATCDAELRYTWIFNPHVDYGHGEILGKRDDELGGACLAPLVALKRRVLESGDESRARISFELPSGEFTYEISAAPLRGERGDVTGVRTVAFEATDRARAEDRLRQLSRVLEDVEDPIHIEDRRGTLLEVNSRVEEAYGWGREELIGQSFEVLIAEEDWEKARRLRRRCLAGEAVHNEEVIRRARDGTRSTTLLTLSPWRDDGGEPAGIVGIAKDISAQKQLIEEKRAEIRAILDTAVDAIVTIDPSGAVASFNLAAKRMFGYRPDEIHGRDFAELLAPPSRRDLERILAEADLGAESERELIGQRRDGRNFPMEVSIGEHRAAADRRFTLILRDITRRKQLESEARQAQKMEAVGRLASGVAHDFNNLLMGITGAATVALAKLEPHHPARLFLEELKASAAGGASITRQLLAFSRQGPIEPRPLDLDEFLERTAPLVRRLLGEDVSVEVRRGAGGRAALLDEGQIQQMLLNLAVNARDAMPSGGTLTIDTRAERVTAAEPPAPLPAGDYVVLSLTDTGCGMDEETRERIFEPFFTTKPPGQGTGLGLSTAYAVVNSTGGHIDVHSRPGEGTRFEIWFPEDHRSPGGSAAARTVRRPARAGGSETILVVEDEDLVRRTLRDMLETAGYWVVEAADGPAAIDAFRAGGVDLVFTDVVLPSVSGQRVADTIRHMAPDVPVIFISAHSREHLMTAGRLPAEERFLQKPFSSDVLFDTLREALARGPRSSPDPA